MSSFWSAWVAILSLGTIFGCLAILLWNLKNYTHVKEGESMGHEFDGIEEINNPLPRWWTYMFLACIVWSFFYLLMFPGLGNWEGLLGWKSSNQGIKNLAESRQLMEQNIENDKYVHLDQQVKYAREKFDPIFEAYAKLPIEKLIQDDKAMNVGKRLYLQNCSQCHASDAKGGNGFPNLTDADWIHGGSFDKIKETLLYGRNNQMMALGAALGDDGVKEVTAYVLSLSGRTVDDDLAAKGKAKFAVCSACHGSDGKGALANNLKVVGKGLEKPATMGLNLTDNVWLYGGSERAVEETIRYGRMGVMPAWKDILGEQKVHLVSAYIYSISRQDDKLALNN
ncbi:cbb3-type cytochrome c oxidase N-terminal domain-containing protein [Algicola sagamiensis]|uniref:cbb3-type cytochrome c oxidase N-terminal domain-containing protein n=1 Tax=Algicola sagamiensis TaxID=163869 RepID=UPI00039980FA|nr:cbb3-type cytochrome c oxidase N-terminal domain-containing protein [Algicola sagamiensis]